MATRAADSMRGVPWRVVALCVLAAMNGAGAEEGGAAASWQAVHAAARRALYEGFPARAGDVAAAATGAAWHVALDGVRSEAWRAGGRFAEAASNDVRIMAHVAAAREADAHALVAAAYAAMRLRRHEDALQLLQRAMRTGGASAEVYVAAGDLYAAADDAARAEQYYRRAAATGDSAVYVAYQRACVAAPGARAAAMVDLATNAAWYFPLRVAQLQQLFADEAYEKAADELAALSATHAEHPAVLSLESLRAETEGDTAGVARLSSALRTHAPEWTQDLTWRSAYWYGRRQFGRAMALAEEARARRPDDDEAVFVLARCHLQQGDATRGRALLEEITRRNPYQRAAFNFLTALDYMDATFVSVTTAHCIVRLHPRDANVIGDEVARLMEHYWAKYTPKYGIRPPVPVRIDMMNRHADFAARSLGVPALGALGVCFGSYIAMTSPLAHQRESNWEQTLRHEFIHVLTLHASAYGIPRWFTEGLSVYEETAPQPYRQRHVLELLGQTGFVSLCSFDRAFMSPHVHGAYQLAAEIVDMLSAQHGWEAVRNAIHAYTNAPFDRTLPARALGVTTQELDAAVLAHITAHVAPRAHHATNSMAQTATNHVAEAAAGADTDVHNFPVQMQAAAAAAGSNEWDRALRLYQRAAHIDPYAPELYAQWLPLLRRAGRPGEAARLARVYAYIAPHDAQAHAELAWALLGVHAYGDARRAYADACYFAGGAAAFPELAAALAAAEEQRTQE